MLNETRTIDAKGNYIEIKEGFEVMESLFDGWLRYPVHPKLKEDL